MSIVLITGTTSGFGEACARKFAQPNNSLIIVARNLEKLESLASELEQQCPVHICNFDIRDAQAVDNFLDDLPKPLRAVDILINNAGLALGMAPAHQADIEDWEIMVDTNIKGLMRMTSRILPGMVERNRGHIVNVGSVAASWPYPGGNAYGGTKAFVQQFSRGLRCDVLGHNVRVTNIEPGMAETNFSNVRMHGDLEKAKQVYEGTHSLEAKDIAEIIYWVTTQPAHVNINTVEVMPTCQAWSPFAVNRHMPTK